MKQTRTNTPNYLKHLNKKKILQYLRDNSETSRAEISSALSISKPTVSAIVDELIAEEWLYEKESAVASSLGGRKPIHLFFNHSAHYMIGIDIGGTLVEIGILNMAGDILALDRFETQVALKEEDLLSKICNTVKGLLQKESLASDKVMAVGVGAPGITDTENGIVIEAPSLGWVNFPLRSELEKQLQLPVYVDNDVNVAVLGEQWKGKAKDAENIILITLGTGVGCGIIVNGQLYRGASYAAGEVGYMITDKNEAKEGYDDIFDGYGFLDSHVGGPSIVKRMERKLKATTNDHPLKRERLTAKRIFDYAKQNDPLASEVIEETVDHIAYALVNVICIFNPQYVILGGGISKSGDWFLPKVEKVLEKHLPLQTEISTTKLDNLSIIGAGALCLREHESLLKDEGVV
ncbi:glucokinase [Evansella vedderi]|uniref:Glucokinase n=1 Tax=Evansella vedderi TaxID=38282 RepID=A0ABT9ZQ16_9BACI|nr:ROK family transcriptional regulator [Evansella vedderi]MDQ0253334.1 glucokinase [Evansella vedderi]